MRLGIFGGSFDPPHVGHLLVVADAFDALGLDHLIFVPAAVQPLKAAQAATSPRHRLEMVRLLVRDDPRFSVDPIEIDREGLSYTVETLAALADRHPHAERFFLVGTDVLGSFAKWREPERVLRLATMAVMLRDGDGGRVPDGAVRVETRRVDVSSTEIRERVRAGRTIRGFVPEAVEAYIAAQRLYR
ncbi:MAG: nicotinate-nucleotide adenylyltransferase [Gemmatimonadaceae bacterium]